MAGKPIPTVERMRTMVMSACSCAGTVRLLGVPLAPVTLDQVLDLVHQIITGRSRLRIGVVNAAKLVNMRRDRLLRDDVLASDIILADGRAVVWASRVLRQSLPERVAGIDLMMGMMQRGHRFKYRFYLLGASEEVSAAVAKRIENEYPGVRIVGRRNGYFSSDEEKNIAQDISQSRPDILLIAMSSPQKERFLARWSETIDVPIWHGVGGSFDVMAGKVQRAPLAWQRLGLEWFFRLKQEPRRLLKRYLLTNTLFCWMTLKEMGKSLKCRADG
jgi:N-acetylglucosaminyldiphosphoundecaprenol N-acetyl-beta-D-mannosaminyltransferase